MVKKKDNKRLAFEKSQPFCLRYKHQVVKVVLVTETLKTVLRRFLAFQ